MRPADLARMDRQVCGAVWTSSCPQGLLENLAYDIGPRPAGSNSMKRAQRLAGQALDQPGFRDIHTEPVHLLAWREASSTVTLISPRQRGYESLHCVHSASGKVRGRLLNGGTASQEELDRLGPKVKGSVLLIDGHVISGTKFVPLPQQVDKACQRGATAILLRSMYQTGDCPAIELVGVSEVLPIPVLAISHESGHELASLLRAGEPRVSIDARGKSYWSQCVNLVADLGPRRAKEIVVLSAHLDCFYVNPGSLDNLTGVITLLEVARALAPLRSQFRRTLRVIIYTGEEYGLWGSKAYVQHHQAELDQIRFVFNMDTLWSATAKGVAVMWSPEMCDHIDAALKQTQCQVDVRNLFCMSSDYLPFMLEGIPAARPADFWNSMPPWSHTRADTPDKIHLDELRLNAMTYAQLLLRLLSDPRPLPARRKSHDEVRSLLEEEDVLDNLRWLDFKI